MMKTSDWFALSALVISIVAVPLSAYLSFLYAKKSFKYEMKEQKILEMINAKERFIIDIDLFGKTAKSIAEYEFGTNFSEKSYVEDYEVFYNKLYKMGLVQILYNDIETLNSKNFDLFLSIYDQILYDGYKSFELSRNNTDITDTKRAHLVYQVFFENKLKERLIKILDKDIRNFLEN